ncbi:MAG: hypothetical protein M1821_007521 [Bathelium mastoideum]|nr:MAG: hypothetical protein M1821_007521 [Bathelium mastoideum]
MAANIKTVGVVGTGVIGMSWIGLFLARGYRVLAASPGPNVKQEVSDHLRSIWPLLERGGLAPGASISNWELVGDSLAGRYHEVDFVQENGPERVDIKSRIVADIDEGTRPEVVIASSSSGLPSSQFIKDCKKNPERVLIAHPYNPPHIMPLVEVVPNPATSKEATDTAMAFFRGLGKAPILLRQEVRGFVANRLQAAITHEAFSLVKRGVVTAKEIGPFMKNVLGGGANAGGFRHLMEHVGVAMQDWLKDMAAHSYEYSEENLNVLDSSVQEMLAGVDIARLEEERNYLMIEVFKAKASAKALV